METKTAAAAQRSQQHSARGVALSDSKSSAMADQMSQLTSNLPVATIESVKLMAESIGIANLNDDAAKEVINDLSFTLKFILLVKTRKIT